MKKSQLKSLTLLPSWIASFLCGYFPDPTRFEPFHNFVVVNGYNNALVIGFPEGGGGGGGPGLMWGLC